jgi:hypothetical protein
MANPGRGWRRVVEDLGVVDHHPVQQLVEPLRPPHPPTSRRKNRAKDLLSGDVVGAGRVELSSEGDPEGGAWPGRVAGVLAEGGAEVDRPGAAERANDQVAQAGHDLRAISGAQTGGVLGEGHIPDVVQAILERPVPPDELGEPGGLAWAKVCW